MIDSIIEELENEKAALAARLAEADALLREARKEVEWWTPDETAGGVQGHHSPRFFFNASEWEQSHLNLWFALRDRIDAHLLRDELIQNSGWKPADTETARIIRDGAWIDSSECTHDLAERETDCADEFCPICLRSRNTELETLADKLIAEHMELKAQLAESEDWINLGASLWAADKKRIHELEAQLAGAEARASLASEGSAKIHAGFSALQARLAELESDSAKRR